MNSNDSYVRRIDVLLLPDRILVNPSSRVPAGYWISHGPWRRLAVDSSPTAIAEAISLSLSASQVGSDMSEDASALSKERLTAAGVGSERAYHTGSALVSVRWERQFFLIIPHSNGGASGDKKGFAPLSTRRVELPENAAANDLGTAVLLAFERCEPSPNKTWQRPVS